ncbi:MAG: TolC family protein [Elusimicrobiota bacterium]
MTRHLLAVILLLAVGPVRGESPMAKKLDLKEAVRLSMLNNPNLLSALEDIAIAEQRIRMARHLRYPHVGLDFSALDYKSESSFVITEHSGGLLMTPTRRDQLYSGRAFFEEELYTGGRTHNAIILAKAALEKAKTLRDDMQIRIVRDVSVRFLEYVHCQRRITLIRELMAKLPARSASSGVAARLLFDDERLELASLLEEAEVKELPVARGALLKAIGMDLSRDIEVTDVIEELEMVPAAPTLEQALSWAREYRPEYKSEALESEIDATEVAIALAGRKPIVSLMGMYELTGADFPLRSNNWSGMLRMHLPFSWDYWTTIRERKAQLRKGQVRKVDIGDKISLEVRQWHGDLSYQIARLKTFRQRERLWQDAYDAAIGGGDPLRDKMELFLRYKRVRLHALQALEDALLARYEFEHAVGRELR